MQVLCFGFEIGMKCAIIKKELGIVSDAMFSLCETDSVVRGGTSWSFLMR